MTFSYDLATDVGKVRLLIPDRNAGTAVFQDEEIEAFLLLEVGVHRAAALALETAASDTVLRDGVVRSLDVDLDGAKASDALRKRAGDLRAQAALLDAQDGGAFDIAEWVTTDFAARDRLANERLRSGL